MRYWFDTEFIELGGEYPIDLISIGIVAEDGRELYMQSAECNLNKASEWVRDNVLTYLDPCPNQDMWPAHYHPAFCCSIVCTFTSRYEMQRNLLYFCSPEKYGKPEFWGYYADYDWVSLCQLFGTMMDLPKGWPKYCLDLKQLFWQSGDIDLPRQEGDGETPEHHALCDARWTKRSWEWLTNALRGYDGTT